MNKLIEERQKLLAEKLKYGAFEYTSDKSLIARFNEAEILAFHSETARLMVQEFKKISEGIYCNITIDISQRPEFKGNVQLPLNVINKYRDDLLQSLTEL